MDEQARLMGIVCPILTEAHKSGRRGIVAVRAHAGMTLVVVGAYPEDELPIVVVQLSPAGRRALIAALAATGDVS